MRAVRSAHIITTIVVVAVLVLAGCTATVPGSAQRAAGGPAPGAVDPALLDHGNYPITPSPPMGTAGTAATGALIDARRMGDFVLGPWEVDPALVTAWGVPYGPGVMPLKPNALGAVFSGADGTTAAAHLVYGFASGREDPGRKQLLNVVLRMTDPQAVTDAITELQQLQQRTRAEQGSSTALTPVPVPGHPQAQALGETFDDSTHQRTWHGVHAYTAHGSYLLFQVAYSTDSIDAAAATAAAMIEAQGPRIDAFAPTDPSQFATLAVDPSGLLARTLPVPQGQGNVSNRATFGPHALLHYEINPVISDAQQVFTDAGVDVAVNGSAWVVRTRDAAGAAAVAEAEARQLSGEPADAVPGLPGSRCVHVLAKNYYWCVATADRYVLEVSGTQLRDVHQKAAAQYLLLTTT